MSTEDAFAESARVLALAKQRLPPLLDIAIQRCLASLERGGKVLVCGNGGSAADAQHLAAELVGRVRRDRAGIPGIALTADSSALTAIGNDYGFDRIFARQLEALARPGDVLIAISTSGESNNVIEAAREARARDCVVIAMTGEGGGRLAEHADVLLSVPSTATSRIQEIHALCIHVLAQTIEDEYEGRWTRTSSTT